MKNCVNYLKAWRVWTCFVLILWLLGAVLTGVYWFGGLRAGLTDSEDVMMKTWVAESSSLTYADFYAMCFTMFSVFLLFAAVCVLSLFYQHCAIKSESLFPKGKRVLPIVTILAHVLAVMVWIVIA